MEKVLPKNWINSSLKEVTRSVKGKKPKVQEEIEFEGSIPYMDIKALEHNIIRKFADKESSKLFEAGDVAMVWDGARSGWVSKTNFGAIGSTITAFKPIKLNSNYLYYFLLDIYPFINSNARGVGIPHVDPTVLYGLNFPLPPLAEQQRIVAKLDGLFTHLEQVKIRLANIPKLLKNFRQAILSQAVTGKLTEEWRVGKELDSVNKYLKQLNKLRETKIDKRDNKTPIYETLSTYSIPKEWKWVRLWDLSYLVTSGSRGWSGYYADEGAYFVRSAEINNNVLRLEEAIKVNLPKKVEGKRSLIQKGNILTTVTGANVGKCAKIEKTIPEAYVSQSVAITKLVDNDLTDYVHLSLLAPNSGGGMLKDMAYGLGRPVLSLPQIKSIQIPLPTKEEQVEIVKRVESLFAKADAIEAKYNTLKAQIDSLPQAILAKAFKGELVSQLPTDGNAADLLKEIQALKAVAVPKKKTKKRVKV